MGQPPDSILRIIGQLESNEISLHIKFKLIACLVPESFFPEEAFLRMSSLLADPQFNENLKVEILKLMISVYSFVDNLSNFKNLFEIFFQLLEKDNLRPYICHLLYKMVGKEQLTKRRMNYIAELTLKYESDHCLIFLLITFFKLFPDLKKMEPKESLGFEFESLGIYPDLIRKVHPSYNIHVPRNFCLNNDETNEPLPPFITAVVKPLSTISHAARDKSCDTQSNKVEHAFIKVYKEVERLKISTKIQDSLHSKYKNLFFPPPIWDCLQRKKSCFGDFLIVSKCNNLKNFTNTLQNDDNLPEEPYQGMFEFTEMYIEQWDESSDLDIAVQLVSFEPFQNIEEILYLLHCIHEKILDSNILKKCDYIMSLALLYENFVLRDKTIHPRSSCLSNVCSETYDDKAYALRKLGDYTKIVCDAYLYDNNFHPCLLNEILLYYERVSKCNVRKNIAMLKPTTTVFHAALFTANPVILENLSKLTLRLHDEIRNMKIWDLPEYEFADVFFKNFCRDILSVLLGKYELYSATDLTKNMSIIHRLSRTCKDSLMFFQFCRHPAIIEKAASLINDYCITNEVDVSVSDIQKVLEVDKSLFLYLQQNDLQSTVELLHFLMNENS